MYTYYIFNNNSNKMCPYCKGSNITDSVYKVTNTNIFYKVYCVDCSCEWDKVIKWEEYDG